MIFLRTRRFCLSAFGLLSFIGACDSPTLASLDGGGGAAGASSVDSEECRGAEGAFASEVLGYEFGDGQDYGQDRFPEIVFGGPDGRGPRAGSLDVVSLGDGGFVELAFGERAIVDGPGPDFIVFENAFEYGEGEIFTELGRVSVSVDGETWVEFPCDAADLSGSACAGREPVLASVVTGEGDAFDPESSGGDLYDLADLGLSEARYVRIADLPGSDDSGDLEEVFDLDAVALVNGRCDP